MPLHDDEMNMRREKREAQRRKQQAEAKRLRITLILAAVVLVLCTAGIVFLTSRSDSSQTTVAAETRPTQKPTQATEPATRAQKSTKTTIHIKAAGDLNVTNTVINAGVAVGGYNYTRAFMDVASTLSDADLTVLNLEGNICGEPYGSDTTSAPRELLDGLRNAGVDLIQMANSCTINNGLIGLTSTLQTIRAAGLEPVGAFASESEFQQSKGYTITEAQGVKVAFVAFTKGLGGRGLPAGNDNLVNILYEDYASTYDKIDRTRITSVLKAVEAEKPDITIALLHWGSEYNDDISDTQKSIVNLMKKQGVDVIIGTHPHTVQAIEYDELRRRLPGRHQLLHHSGFGDHQGFQHRHHQGDGLQLHPHLHGQRGGNRRRLPPGGAYRQGGGSLGGKLPGQSQPVGEGKHGPRAGAY